jgi:outer membrane protein OmpA-like peptidoglycan-associated protein
MVHSLRGLAAAAALAVLSSSAGCVSMQEHNRLKEQFEGQEKYVQAHKDEVKEFEKRERLGTMQKIEQQKQFDLLLARLEKSERLRKEGESTKTVVASVTPEATAAPMLTGFQINKDTGGIVLENDVLFSPGKSELKGEGKKELDKIISKMNTSDFSRYQIRVDGHTDSDPVTKSKGTNVDNWGLSAQRALCVLRYLEGHGITSDRLFCAGFGSQRPISGAPEAKKVTARPEPKLKSSSKKGGKHEKHEKHPIHEKLTDDPGKAQNRRVEIVLFEKKA